jgi:hypothetical protein
MLRTYINPLNAIRVFSFPVFSFRSSPNFVERATSYEGYRSLTDEQVNQLIGETVAYTAGSVPSTFVMTADTWTYFGQVVGTSGPITAIGKLTIV